MDQATRRLLYGIFAAVAAIGLIIVVIAILLVPPGVATWIDTAFVLVLLAVIAEVVLFFVGRPKRPQDEAYDFVIDGSGGR